MAIDFNALSRGARNLEEGNVNNRANGSVSDGDSDDGFSDVSSGLTELGSGEFAGYFQERNGRLFHSHGGLPYPLPVDTPEQEVRHTSYCCPLRWNAV